MPKSPPSTSPEIAAEEITKEDIARWQEEDVANLIFTDEEAKERMVFEKEQETEAKIQEQQKKKKPKVPTPQPTPAQPQNSDLLEFVGTVLLPNPVTISGFVAKDNFVKDTSRKAKVRISYLVGNFTKWFLKGAGKIEDPNAAILYYYRLRTASLDAPIISELGGETKAQTTLTDLFSQMAKQPNGETGALLNNGWWNIFYIPDTNEVLRTVCVGWHDVGWCVYACSLEVPYLWSGDFRVFSRNSVLKS